MIEFSKIFNDLVDQINNEIVIDSKLSSGNSTIIFTCNTKWARSGKTLGLKSGDVIYNNLIEEVSTNNFIKVKGNIFFDQAFVNSPFDITGTKIATNLEWNKVSNFAKDKLPLIWLLDSFDETIYGREQSLERSVDCKIFFLDETDIKNFYTADHKREVIQPMIALKDEFVNVIKKNRIFKTLENEKIKYFSRFGTESAQGFEKNILDANLSGLVLQINLQKYKGNCNC
jgi:hypothetical protein